MKTSFTIIMLMIMSSFLVAQSVAVSNTASIGSLSTTSLTLSSFTVAANNDRQLLVCVTTSSGFSVSGVTFGGTSMTQIGTEERGGVRATMFYLVLGSSSSQTQGDIVATGSNLKQIGAVAFYNVEQSNPYDGFVTTEMQATTGQTLPSTLSLNVSSRSNDLVCDCFAGSANGLSSITADASQTGQINNTSPGTRIDLGISIKAGASPTVNMGWTLNGTLTTGQAVLLGINVRASNPPLPIELTYFKGQAVKNGNKLLWQTASELNNKGFYIQRSKDAVNWQDLTFESGKGTTLTANNYEWLDNAPLIGYNYYRLQQVDYDGSFKFSPVLLIRDGKKDKIVVYPNPSSSDLFYESDDLESVKRIQLFDAIGKLLHETTNIDGKFSITNFPSGLYWFVIETSNGNIYERIIKQ